MNLISKSLHYIGSKYKNTFVVQIGAMDGINFDDTRGFLNLYDWNALLVEPVPALFEELKNNFKDKSNYIFEQCAITDSDGEIEMLTIPPDVIEREGLHPGYKGMSALYPLKNGFGSNYQRDIDVKKQFGINVKVPSLTFESLLSKNNINKFDILICDAEGYDWNIFKQIDLNKYKPKFIRLEYINLTNEEKQLTKQKLEDNGYVVEINQDIDAVLKETWEEINKPPKSKSNLTVVTGLWNISRPGRNFDHYIHHFNNFLDIDANLFIYIPQEYEHLVWAKRSKENTYVKIYDLDDIKHMYSPFWDKTQEIRNNPDWFNITGEGGWLKSSPQAANEWYNPIVQSKMFLLNDVTIWNPFDTEKFIWLDAGITNTVYEKYFTDNKVLDKIEEFIDPFLFLSYPYDANDEIHGFKFKELNKYAGDTVKWVCRGGLFGGTKKAINNANGLYYALLSQSLGEGLMGTEESIFAVMSYLEPETYRRYSLDGNGLIIKFIQALDEGKVELEPIPEKRIRFKEQNKTSNDVKTSVYMLTFNFPEQVEHTIQTYLKHDKWLTQTRNILIDNSTNDEARNKNKELCDKYNFEHIITGKNGGICGGRQLAAEHFQESDSDYYIFLEDDMQLHEVTTNYCRNGFRQYIPDLYDKIHRIMIKSDLDFLKLSFTEVYMDNNIQVSWYNVPQNVRTQNWPDYDKLPTTGLDPNAPRTKFDKIEVVDGLSYVTGEIYYANWPMIVGKKGNQKMFLDTTWAHPYEQTWMSHMYQETIKGNLKPGVLLASPINHNRFMHYRAEDRREN